MPATKTKRTLYSAAVAMIKAWESLPDPTSVLEMRALLAPSIREIRIGIAAEKTTSAERARASALRRLTPEQRAAKRAKLTERLALLDKVEG